MQFTETPRQLKLLDNILTKNVTKKVVQMNHQIKVYMLLSRKPSIGLRQVNDGTIRVFSRRQAKESISDFLVPAVSLSAGTLLPGLP